MESRQLHYFLAIASCENMSEAAEVLHISQPALSSALRNLEKEIGHQLFDRVGKKLVINENGRYLAKQAHTAFAILDDAKRTIQDNADKQKRTVCCGMNIPVGNIGALLAGFYKEHGDISISMGYPTSGQFANRPLDMELMGSAVKLEGSNVIPLGRERILLVMPPNHPLANKPDLKLADLKDEPFVFTNPSEMRTLTETMCREAGFTPKIVMETQLYSEALSLVAHGIGCCLGGEFAWLLNMDEAYDFVARDPVDAHRFRYLYARIPEHQTPSEAAWAFINYLQDCAEGSN